MRQRIPRSARPKPPHAAIVTYRRALFAAVTDAKKQFLTLVEPRLRRDAKSPKSVHIVVDPTVIDTVFGRVAKKTATETQRLIGVTSDISKTAQRAFRKENLALISSLEEYQIGKLGDLLDEAFERGDRIESIRAMIEDRFDVTRSHADLIANDQVLKLNGQLTMQRQTRAGITRYQWSTSNDERVRPEHADLDGKIFTWGNPPVTNEDGDENDPGGDFRCRCLALPVLDDQPDDADD